ncbi:MAG TPA: hypothetical protein VMZ25_08270 [Terriglobales bacterium]|nr:hypothetical protein [Terriglobales bacterium]
MARNPNHHIPTATVPPSLTSISARVSSPEQSEQESAFTMSILKRFALIFCAASLVTVALAQDAQPPAANKGVRMTVAVQPGVQALPALPVGTPVKMKLETAVSTSTSKAGDLFAGKVTEAVMLDGKAVIPVGSSISGKILRAEEKRRYKGAPVIEIRPEQVTLPNGDVYSITAVVADTTDRDNKVDDEGRIKGKTLDRRDKLEMAGGAGVGAGVGALTAGGKGSLIGAAIGGGGAVIYWLTKHKSASLPAGTEIIFELDRPMTMSVANSD